MKLPQLHLRDLFYLVLLVAVACGWWNDHVRLTALIEEAAELNWLRAHHQEHRPSKRVSSEMLGRIRALDDESLAEKFAFEYGQDSERFEAYLTELARRRLVEPLQTTYQIFQVDGDADDVEPLIALRRAQGKPDPIEISIEWPDQPVVAAARSLPELTVTVKNVDVERASFRCTRGGDDRSGRHDKWQLTLTDEQNRQVSWVEYVSLMGGGLAGVGPLAYGESYSFGLDMRDYLETPEPGKYQLQAFYRHSDNLVEYADMTGLIVSASAPVPFEVQRPVIRLSRAEHQLAQQSLQRLDFSQPLKLVAGSYGAWAHKFVDPLTPHGQLLSLREKAVPALIESVARPNLTERDRAWLLALLYSATGEYDPRSGPFWPARQVLCDGEFISGPWLPWGTNQGMSRGLISGHGACHWGATDPVEQKAFVRRWLHWYKTVDVKFE